MSKNPDKILFWAWGGRLRSFPQSGILRSSRGDSIRSAGQFEHFWFSSLANLYNYNIIIIPRNLDDFLCKFQETWEIPQCSTTFRTHFNKWQQHVTLKTCQATSVISTRPYGYGRIANTMLIHLRNYELTRTHWLVLKSLDNTNHFLYQIRRLASSNSRSSNYPKLLLW